MVGAIIGDIAGSRFEFNNTDSKRFEFMPDSCYFTDDTVMTCAIAEAVMEAGADCDRFYDSCVRQMVRIGKHYPNCGYGARFIHWMFGDQRPYGSMGNGSAMRVSPVAWCSDSLEMAEKLARISALPSHDDPEGIKAAVATAGCQYLAMTGSDKQEIRAYASRYYDLGRGVDEIRANNYHTELAPVTTPQAIICFLESESFEDAIRNCISIGGDSDTIAATCGAIAEAFYGVPEAYIARTYEFLDARLADVLRRFREKYVTGKGELHGKDR